MYSNKYTLDKIKEDHQEKKYKLLTCRNTLY